MLIHNKSSLVTHLHDILENLECIPFCITEFELLEFREVLVIVFKKGFNGLYETHKINLGGGRGIEIKIFIQYIEQ